MSLTRSLEGAKKAYSKKDIQATIAAHSQNAKGKPHSPGTNKKNNFSSSTTASEEHKQGGEYLKSAIYGGLDGTITTFAVVAGVTGAALSPAIILILGFANLIGDGISMAIGDYLSTKAENEYYLSEREREEWEVDTYPQGEKREMVEIYMQKGMSKSDADAMVKALSKHKKAWVDVMMLEELGMVKNEGSPLKNALVTFASFAIFGFIPLAAYVFSLFFAQFAQDSFMLACALTALTLFMLGALKTKITGKNWAYCGAEMLAVGSLAAGAAYLVGVFLSGLA